MTDPSTISLLWTLIALLSLLLSLQIVLVLRLQRKIPDSEQSFPPWQNSMEKSVHIEVQPPPSGSVLKIEQGNEEGFYFRLKPGGVTWVGRDSAVNDVVLSGDLISRQHVRIESVEGGYLLHDLDSTNGTYINGSLVTSALLNHGDTITVGDVVLRFFEKPAAEKISG